MDAVGYSPEKNSGGSFFLKELNQSTDRNTNDV